MDDLDRFSALLGEIRLKSQELSRLTLRVAGAMQQMKHEDSGEAVKLGMATAAGAVETWRRLLERFEAEALQVLGERRRVNEEADAFFSRICTAETEELLAMMMKNDVRLVATRGKR